MRCVICGSTLPEKSNCKDCNAPLCPEAYGPECHTAHRKQLHPIESNSPISVMGFVKNLKAELKATQGRAVIAEGLVSHWKEVNRENEVNAKARFGALVKFMKTACPDQLAKAERHGLASEADILPEA